MSPAYSSPVGSAPDYQHKRPEFRARLNGNQFGAFHINPLRHPVAEGISFLGVCVLPKCPEPPQHKGDAGDFDHGDGFGSVEFELGLQFGSLVLLAGHQAFHLLVFETDLVERGPLAPRYRTTSGSASRSHSASYSSTRLLP